VVIAKAASPKDSFGATHFEKPKSECMKTRSVTPMGSLHPVLFFAGVYVVVLLFSIFICSSLFYSCNSSSAKPIGKKGNAVQEARVAMK
jgi:hypothetical protein